MLPIALRTLGRRALLAGGGTVALRKAETLRDAGLHVHVVAPDVDPRIEAAIAPNGSISRRRYQRDDLDGVLIAVAATNDSAVNAQILADGRVAHVLVCDASRRSEGDFTMQATVRIGDLTFTVDSGGSTPAFSKRLARELRERFGDEYANAARVLERMRAYVQATVESSLRAPVLRALAEMPVDELARMNSVELEHAVEAALSRVIEGGVVNRTSHIICASRASALAMIQTKTIAARLAENGIATTILNVTTTGDRVQDRPVAAIGTVNVFVKELEIALRERRADYAVHSCKDLPGILEADMTIAAISRRDDARDVFCSEQWASFESLPAGAVVGTSSLRRQAQLHAMRSDLRYEDIRGNVDTRLRKLRDGDYDAIVLAVAGLDRLRVHATHTVPFAVDTMVPAVGQGALAIETRADDDGLAQRLHTILSDRETELTVSCERSALATLRAGCNAPLGIHATLDREMMTVRAVLAETGVLIRRERRGHVTTIDEARNLGASLAADLSARSRNGNAPTVVLARSQARPSRIAEALRRRGMNVVEVHDGERPIVAPDMLVFPSSGAVDAARAFLSELQLRNARPVVAAMGPQSGDAARSAGFAPDLFAPEASVDAFVAVIAEYFERS